MIQAACRSQRVNKGVQVSDTCRIVPTETPEGLCLMIADGSETGWDCRARQVSRYLLDQLSNEILLLHGNPNILLSQLLEGIHPKFSLHYKAVEGSDNDDGVASCAILLVFVVGASAYLCGIGSHQAFLIREAALIEHYPGQVIYLPSTSIVGGVFPTHETSPITIRTMSSDLEKLEPTQAVWTLVPGDRLILCDVELSMAVPNSELSVIASQKLQAGEMCDVFVQTAISRGVSDVSCITAQYVA